MPGTIEHQGFRQSCGLARLHPLLIDRAIGNVVSPAC
jgi:hypothetical protein